VIVIIHLQRELVVSSKFRYQFLPVYKKKKYYI